MAPGPFRSQMLRVSASRRCRDNRNQHLRPHRRIFLVASEAHGEARKAGADPRQSAPRRVIPRSLQHRLRIAPDEASVMCAVLSGASADRSNSSLSSGVRPSWLRVVTPSALGRPRRPSGRQTRTRRRGSADQKSFVMQGWTWSILPDSRDHGHHQHQLILRGRNSS
jgi:hypothetical protein